MREKDAVYVVQGRSGIVFLVTYDYAKAQELKNGLDEINGDRGILSTWINDKCVSRDSTQTSSNK